LWQARLEEQRDSDDTVRRLEQVLDAARLLRGWAEGRPTTTARLGHTVAVLSEVARQSPSFSDDPSQPDSSQWYRLLERVQSDLHPEPVHASPEPTVIDLVR
jgi:hypothetical protein